MPLMRLFNHYDSQYLLLDPHAAMQMRKAVTGEDMGALMAGLPSDAIADELEVVRCLKE